MYSVDCCPKGLVIGKQGENEAEKIAIDFSPWASEFGAGTISARLRRPKDSAAYPVALITEGTTATWTISATDTQYAGAGSLQLVYIVGDVVAKSVIWPVRVLPSLEAGEAPEPYESWLDTLEGLAADTQGNARDAAASAADAAQSATSAAASAQDAAESAASITGLTAVAETLPEGSEASASFDGATDTLTLGIPKGDTGAAGPKGDTGSAGADGFSPSATVTKQDGNITITITDKDGTTSETLEVDDALDETSENPVQNAAIVEAMRSMLPVDTASGSIASFPDGADNVPVKSLVVQIEPIQEGSGDPSPDNVRPISGHTEVVTEVCGVNLADDSQFSVEQPSWYEGQYWLGLTDNGDGTYTETRPIGWGGYGLVYVGTFKSGTYFVSAELKDLASVTCAMNYIFKRKGTWDTVESYTNSSITSLGRYGASKTISEECDLWIVCAPYISNGANVKFGNIQVEVGTVMTDYHAYQGETVQVSWESEAGTVYGGTLDVVSGKLMVDMAIVDLGMLNWARSGTNVSGEYRFTANIPVEIATSGSVVPDMLCSHYKAISPNGTYTQNQGVSNNTNLSQVMVFDAAYKTYEASAFKTAMDGIQLVYPLAEPIEYTLTAQEVRTFLGQNNIWNDTGDTEVTYRADIQKYIEKKVNA